MVLGGVYSGAITNNTKNFVIAGYNEAVKTSVADYIDKDMDSQLRLLISCIHSAISPPHALPIQGAWLDQTPHFREALEVWRGSEGLWRKAKEANKELLKTLGGNNVGSKRKN